MFNRLLVKRAFSTKKGRSNISNDLVISASMGYAGKENPTTHVEHLQALNKLNLYDDLRIEQSLDRIQKAYFCHKKPYENAEDEVPFVPYSLDPQVIGYNQVLTSSVMHAITLSKLVKPLELRKNNPDFAMVDIGCGTGYSTLLYADLASQILKS